MEMINIILNILMWISIVQLTTIAHELGHAIPALFFSKDKVRMYLGIAKNNEKSYSIGSLQVVFRGFHPFTGFVRWNNNKLSRIQESIAVIGGPITSLLIAISLFLFGNSFGSGVLTNMIKLTAYYNFYQFIVTAIPIQYPSWWGGYGGYKSDGLNALEMLKIEVKEN
ncbi:site-2 protease family protein [Clostridium sp.]|uniref:site-2 protease family protein n=1 Tax=Clostridium sp. TaxID=1506 RepID=UPI002FCAB3BA